MEDVQAIEISCIVIKEMIRQKSELINEALGILNQLFSALYCSNERTLEALCSLIENLFERVDFPSIQSRFGMELKTGLFVENSTIQRLAIIIVSRGLGQDSFSMELFDALIDHVKSENVEIYQLVLNKILSTKLSMKNRLYLVKRLDFLYKKTMERGGGNYGNEMKEDGILNSNPDPLIQVRIIDFLLRLKHFSWSELGKIISSKEDAITMMIIQESLACNIETDKDVASLESNGILKIISETIENSNNNQNGSGNEGRIYGSDYSSCHLEIFIEILSKSLDKRLVCKYMPSGKLLNFYKDQDKRTKRKEAVLFGMGKLFKFYNDQIEKREIIDIIFEELTLSSKIVAMNSLVFIVKSIDNDNIENDQSDYIYSRLSPFTDKLERFCNNINLELKEASYELVRELLKQEWYLEKEVKIIFYSNYYFYLFKFLIF